VRQVTALNFHDSHPPSSYRSIDSYPQSSVTWMRLITYLGYLAGALTVVSLWPQVLRTWRTKQSQDLSIRTFVLLITAGALWIAYGVLSTDWPVIATNTGMVILNGAILVAKLKFS
jgi:MtN3 and saliva related transmembrane protein